METIWWKTRVMAGSRMIERMKFLLAYWGRKTNNSPEEKSNYTVADALRRSVERAFEEVRRDLRNQVLNPESSYDEKQQAQWWLKLCLEGRNGDPFPGVTYSAGESDNFTGGRRQMGEPKA